MSDPRERVSRRKALSGAGALIVSFCLGRAPLAQEPAPAAPAQPPPQHLPGSLRASAMLDALIRIDGQGITVFTGKAELGQGIKTALLQVAAEELHVEPGLISLITADTARTPDEGYTAGSQSMQESATALRHAAAQARELLIEAAAKRFAVPPDELTAHDGAVNHGDGRSASYRELSSADLLHVAAQPHSKLKVLSCHWPTNAASGHSHQGVRRRCLRAGPAAAPHGTRARGSPTQLWCAAAFR
jgi:CO/xanthine dehydrogenase Mo-binding subunit